MATSDPAGDDLRLARRLAKIGRDAACAVCGEVDPFALVLHDHHVALEANDPVTVCRLCLNHHVIAHERLRRVGVVEWEPAAVGFLDRQVMKFRALADFHRLLADGWDRDAQDLAAFVEWLDAVGVCWREWREVKP
ncbi:MAG: hypothetical protein ACLPUG_15610 [Acidimicrobiales bacterium]